MSSSAPTAPVLQPSGGARQRLPDARQLARQEHKEEKRAAKEAKQEAKREAKAAKRQAEHQAAPEPALPTPPPEDAPTPPVPDSPSRPAVTPARLTDFDDDAGANKPALADPQSGLKRWLLPAGLVVTGAALFLLIRRRARR